MNAQVLGAVADVLLLHHPSYSWLDGSADGTYAPLRHIPLERVLLGHLLGLSSIPLGEAAGTYLIYDLLKPAFGARTATASVAIGAYLIALGAAYHACLFPLAYAAQQLARPGEVDLQLMFFFYPRRAENRTFRPPVTQNQKTNLNFKKG